MIKSLIDNSQHLALIANKDAIVALGAIIAGGWFFLRGKHIKDMEQIYDEFYIDNAKGFYRNTASIILEMTATGRQYMEENHPEIVPKDKSNWDWTDIENQNKRKFYELLSKSPVSLSKDKAVQISQREVFLKFFKKYPKKVIDPNYINELEMKVQRESNLKLYTTDQLLSRYFKDLTVNSTLSFLPEMIVPPVSEDSDYLELLPYFSLLPKVQETRFIHFLLSISKEGVKKEKQLKTLKLLKFARGGFCLEMMNNIKSGQSKLKDALMKDSLLKNLGFFEKNDIVRGGKKSLAAILAFQFLSKISKEDPEYFEILEKSNQLHLEMIDKAIQRLNEVEEDKVNRKDWVKFILDFNNEKIKPELMGPFLEYLEKQKVKFAGNQEKLDEIEEGIKQANKEYDFSNSIQMITQHLISNF